ncbi:MAG: hypothetical protein DRG31_06175 [Deltaproteobacteria bacterium]|nr:MAG: hypothetical protein DRG31_06175 [Deltaproteobacteria bacterium]
MRPKPKLKVKRPILLLSVFYLVAGLIEVSTLFMDFRLLHVGLLAILSFMIAYGLIRMKRWSIWLMVAFLFLALTFSISSLYASVSIYSFYPNLGILLFHISLILYMLLCLFSTAYVLSRRMEFH